MEKENTLLLTKMEYAHIINNNDGKVRLVEGPFRGTLEANEEIYGDKESKIILKDGQYAIVLNPMKMESPGIEKPPEPSIQYGDREVRIGPMMFSLYPGEELDRTRQVGRTTFRGYKKRGRKHDQYGEIVDEDDTFYAEDKSFDGIRDAYILKHNKGLLIKALRDFDDDYIGEEDVPDENIQGDKSTKIVHRNAGEEWIVKGPCHFIPHKYAQVKRKVKSISLGSKEGVYVKDIKTGEIRLEQGPSIIMLTPDEELWEKDYTRSELDAMKFREELMKDPMEGMIIDEEGHQVRKEVVDIPIWARAYPLWILENEVAMIMTEEDRRIEVGPTVIMLEPFERVYVMVLSGGTPKGEKTVKIWRVKIGPNFSTDEIDVRTGDNAVLSIRVRYQWRFKYTQGGDTEKIFAVSDFIGLATETIGSIIRSECAKHKFEKLHSDATNLIEKAVFGDKESYLFEENGLEVIGIDIKRILPKDKEIAHKLNEAIKSNMEVFVDKIRQQAQLEAEREKIKAQKDIEDEREALIEIQQKNFRTEKIGKAKIEAEAVVAEAQGEADALEIKKQKEIEMETQKIQKIIETVKAEGGENYLKVLQIESLAKIPKAIIPESSQLLLGGRTLNELIS
jgi:major vault protein